jgi:hypothetical protein
VGVWYSTREEVKSSLDIKGTARDNARVDRAIEAASRSVEQLTRRRFYPEIDTRYFDWPNRSGAPSWRIWLGVNEVLALTSVVAGGTTIVAADYFLEPANEGPPYDSLEIDRASSASFSSGDTSQRAVALTGTFGANTETDPAGTMSTASINTTATSFAVSDSGTVGIGTLLLLDSEYVCVTGKSLLTTGLTITEAQASSNAATTLTVSGAGLNVGEELVIDSEVMLVTDVPTSTTAIVKRAWDSSVLAAHLDNATIYARRTLTVERAWLGTTAASHTTGAISKLVYPGPIISLTIAMAQQQIMTENSGQSADLKDISHLVQQVRRDYGRLGRVGAI